MSRESRQEVIELRKLYLQLAFDALRSLCKDVENQLAAVDHANHWVAEGPWVDRALEVPLLGRTQGVIENQQVDASVLHKGLQLVDLARSYERADVGRTATLGRGANHDCACRLAQPTEFGQRLLDRVQSLVCAGFEAYQERPFGILANLDGSFSAHAL